ncbi:hypothetical protein EON65_05895 [archaeon]|nr:MAG: hypothetical protein EON65_05895 [archaeon]
MVISYRGFDLDSQPTRNHSSDLSATEPRGRAVSSSSAGSVSRQSGSQYQYTPRYNNAKKTLTTSVDKTNKNSASQAVFPKPESNAGASADQNPLKGLDYAWNVFNEILK